MPTASGSLHLETSKGKFDFFMTGAVQLPPGLGHSRVGGDGGQGLPCPLPALDPCSGGLEVQHIVPVVFQEGAVLKGEDLGPLHLETSKGKFDFFMTGAGMENNREMLESFAAKLNSRDTGVTAAVSSILFR